MGAVLSLGLAAPLLPFTDMPTFTTMLNPNILASGSNLALNTNAEELNSTSHVAAAGHPTDARLHDHRAAAAARLASTVALADSQRNERAEEKIPTDEEREARHNHSPDAKKLPTGTCEATNPDLKGRKAAQLQWNNWCDEVCIDPMWGGVGAHVCVNATGTGAVGCVCTQGVALVDIYPNRRGNRTSNGAAEQTAEPSETAATSAGLELQGEPSVTAAVPSSTPTASIAPTEAAVPTDIGSPCICFECDCSKWQMFSAGSQAHIRWRRLA